MLEAREAEVREGDVLSCSRSLVAVDLLCGHLLTASVDRSIGEAVLFCLIRVQHGTTRQQSARWISTESETGEPHTTPHYIHRCTIYKSGFQILRPGFHKESCIIAPQKVITQGVLFPIPLIGGIARVYIFFQLLERQTSV